MNPALRPRLIFDLIELLHAQVTWSKHTFGTSDRTQGITEHILSEVAEVRAAAGTPEVLEEWIDIAILALDGAWRAGYTPEQVCEALASKAYKNRKRKWPPLAEQNESRAAYHVKD